MALVKPDIVDGRALDGLNVRFRPIADIGAPAFAGVLADGSFRPKANISFAICVA